MIIIVVLRQSEMPLNIKRFAACTERGEWKNYLNIGHDSNGGIILWIFNQAFA